MTAEQLEILKKKLDQEYAPLLPPLIKPNVNQDANDTKNRSRAYTAYGLCKILSIAPIIGAQAVIDDFEDNGIDAIYYLQNEKKIYIVQGKLKPSDAFRQEDATNFITGVRNLVNQDYTRFNNNVKKRE